VLMMIFVLVYSCLLTKALWLALVWSVVAIVAISVVVVVVLVVSVAVG
jgi:hypothetical protein